jgi:integrase
MINRSQLDTVKCTPQGAVACDSVPAEANLRAPFTTEEMERMGRRRFQDPKPIKQGNFWYLLVWQNTPGAARKRQRIQLAPASMPEREVAKIAAEKLRSLNQGVISVGSAVNLMHFVTDTYEKTALPLLAKGVQKTYQGAIRKHVRPVFQKYCLRDLTPVTLQTFFSGLHVKGVPYPTIVKTRDALSSVLRAAVEYEFLSKNPLESVQLPPDKRGLKPKAWITPAQFSALLDLMPEPYATMVYLAVWTGLRVSELAGLRWRAIHSESITVEQRYYRGDWSCTKTPGSAATIAVDSEVIDHIHRLKTLTVDVRAGKAVRHFKLVKSDGPDDLVFQSVWRGRPMNDANVLKRFIKPAARQLNCKVNWRSLRTSCATWMVQAGADPKSVQGQMRHSRISTTMDIYAQFVPEGQKQAIRQLRAFVERSVPNVPLVFH